MQKRKENYSILSIAQTEKQSDQSMSCFACLSPCQFKQWLSNLVLVLRRLILAPSFQEIDEGMLAIIPVPTVQSVSQACLPVQSQKAILSQLNKFRLRKNIHLARPLCM